ncbi:hypothetical protein Taro_012155, partial [Colocasia esculenta]|nr:hypothetical protein [Colocasia esculenta]
LSTAESLQDSLSDSLELRFWASYRGQTLARTGMISYIRIEDGYSIADYINTEGYDQSPVSRAQADLKFTYVVSCQIYGQQKQKRSPEATDIALLMQR